MSSIIYLFYEKSERLIILDWNYMYVLTYVVAIKKKKIDLAMFVNVSEFETKQTKKRKWDNARKYINTVKLSYTQYDTMANLLLLSQKNTLCHATMLTELITKDQNSWHNVDFC